MGVQKRLSVLVAVLYHIMKVILDIHVAIVGQIKELIVGRKILDLTGKVALIINYNDSNLGRALRDELLKRNCKVCVTTNSSFRKSTETTLNSTKPYTEYQLNTANYFQVQSLKSSIEDAFGTVDILVVLSPEIPDMNIIEACEGNYALIMRDTLKSHFWSAKCFLDGMVSKKDGHIVTVVPFGGRSDIANVLRRATTGFLEAWHGELIISRKSFISMTYVNDYRFRENSLEEERVAARKIIRGLITKARTVNIKSKVPGQDPDSTLKDLKIVFMRILLAILITIKTKLTDWFGKESKKNISHQVALVTGGGMGLGRQIAISLAKQGCNVAIADIDLENAQKTADDLVKYRVKSKAYKIDVSSLTHIVRLKLDIRKDFGEVDIIVNNAGLMPVATVSQAKMRTIEKTIDVNLISHLLMLKEFLPDMLSAKRGHIVAISSMAGVQPLPVGVVYTTTKFGVVGLMDSLDYELKKSKRDFVKVTTVHPYFIKTRADLVKVLSGNPLFNIWPWLEADFVGRKVVEAILKEERRVFIPNSKNFLLLTTLVPPAVKDYIAEKLSKHIPVIKSEGNILT